MFNLLPEDRLCSRLKWVFFFYYSLSFTTVLSDRNSITFFFFIFLRPEYLITSEIKFCLKYAVLSDWKHSLSAIIYTVMRTSMKLA